MTVEIYLSESDIEKLRVTKRLSLEVDLKLEKEERIKPLTRKEADEILGYKTPSRKRRG